MATSTVTATRRPSSLSKGWVQVAALVALSGLFGLVLMGWMTYQSSPPTPKQVVSTAGRTVFTGTDIRAGQDVFLRNGLMEYGSIFGHGAYLGPDFTADYLHRSAQGVQAAYGGAASDTAAQRPGRLQDQPVRRRHRRADDLQRAGSSVHRPDPPPRRDTRCPQRAKRPAAERDHRPGPDPPAHVVLRLERLVRGGQPARKELQRYQQLAVGAAGRQRAERGHGGVERAQPGRAARRHRRAVRCLRPVELARLARPRGPGA